jgi:hypothetical protein
MTRIHIPDTDRIIRRLEAFRHARLSLSRVVEETFPRGSTVRVADGVAERTFGVVRGHSAVDPNTVYVDFGPDGGLRELRLVDLIPPNAPGTGGGYGGEVRPDWEPKGA